MVKYTLATPVVFRPFSFLGVAGLVLPLFCSPTKVNLQHFPSAGTAVQTLALCHNLTRTPSKKAAYVEAMTKCLPSLWRVSARTSPAFQGHICFVFL